MRVLLDHNLDHRFGRLLAGHDATTTRKMGWDLLRNGQLLSVAEDAGFRVIITGDKGFLHQQSLAGRNISVIVLNTRLVTLPRTRHLVPEILTILDDLPSGEFITVGP